MFLTADSPHIYDLFRQQRCGVVLRANTFGNRYGNKTGCFAGGGDEYAVISDDCNFYIWKLPLIDCHGKNVIIFT